METERVVHTPGPWSRCLGHNKLIIYGEIAGHRVAETIDDTETSKANARLIRAAPRMYDLLRKVSLRAQQGPKDCLFESGFDEIGYEADALIQEINEGE